MTDHRTLYDVLYAALGLGLYLARNTWRLVRERNYSRELLRREQQLNTEKLLNEQRLSIERQNELVTRLATAYSSGQTPTLDDLLNKAEHDWSLKSSKTPRAPVQWEPNKKRG